MVTPAMLILHLAIAIAIILVCIIVLKLNASIGMVLACLYMGGMGGLGLMDTVSTISSGFCTPTLIRSRLIAEPNISTSVEGDTSWISRAVMPMGI